MRVIWCLTCVHCICLFVCTFACFDCCWCWRLHYALAAETKDGSVNACKNNNTPGEWYFLVFVFEKHYFGGVFSAFLYFFAHCLLRLLRTVHGVCFLYLYQKQKMEQQMLARATKSLVSDILLCLFSNRIICLEWVHCIYLFVCTFACFDCGWCWRLSYAFASEAKDGTANLCQSNNTSGEWYFLCLFSYRELFVWRGWSAFFYLFAHLLDSIVTVVGVCVMYLHQKQKMEQQTLAKAIIRLVSDIFCVCFRITLFIWGLCTAFLYLFAHDCHARLLASASIICIRRKRWISKLLQKQEYAWWVIFFVLVFV